MNRKPIRIDPNPRLVWMIDFAIEALSPRLRDGKYADWLAWSKAWRSGQRSPAACVEIARECFAQESQLVWHTLGQIAWGAKEACYSTPQSGWLVLRYVADAMVDFGIRFPTEVFPLLEEPTHRIAHAGIDAGSQET